jgi:hypothetical protein
MVPNEFSFIANSNTMILKTRKHNLRTKKIKVLFWDKLSLKNNFSSLQVKFDI